MKNLMALLFFIPLFTHAQISHTVAPKETLYSLARKYNISPKDLAAYNNIPVQTGLTIGQSIKIPSKGNTPLVKNTPVVKAMPVVKKDEATIETGSLPVYHKVEKKETLYHISKLYNNVTVDDIKKWNNLSTDGVEEGTNLIVGYQKEKKTMPAVSAKPSKENIETKTVAAEPVKQIPVKEKAETPEKNITADTRPIVPPVTTASKQETNKVTGKNFNGGFFKNVYDAQVANKKDTKEETGTAAVFKSTSGWEDGKYYCLHNTAPAGAVVKITNKATQKFIYAKVLDVIPDLKQNSGILIRLSNAAADELGAGENNFEAILNY